MAKSLYIPYIVDGSTKKVVDIALNNLINISSISSMLNWQDYTFYWYQIIKNQGTSGIYTLPEEHYNNILQLTSQLATIKKNSGYDFIITSGYRPLSNGSDHSRGAAADIWISSHNDRKKLFDHIYNGNYKWRQLIWEDKKKSPNLANRGDYPNYPGIIHFAYKTGELKKQTLYSENNGDKCTPYKPGESTVSNSETPSNTDNQQITEGNENLNQTDQGDLLVSSFNETLEQADLNIKNLEANDVDETWGQGYSYGTADNSKRDNWISLKQYILYLCTRFSPQSVYPFIELIPSAILSNQDWDRDGQSILNEENTKTMGNKTFKSNSQAGSNATKKAQLKADLWSLDPYEESYSNRDEYDQWTLSNAGQNVYNKRLTGVRIYSQLVLMPEADDISPSKPGGIGFTDLTINAGAQCDNGIAMITMKLIDVQGNKFTDLNSPWSFIYDARQGGSGGDFYFRFGWQLRLPDPNDKENSTSNKFWNHEGWLLFDDKVRQFIASQITASKPYITLTQSINSLPSTEKNSTDRYALFDEGVELLTENNSITVARTNLQPMNYVKLAILNPEIDVEPDGTIVATLNFRTVGALAATIPLAKAFNLKKAISNNTFKGSATLGDLIILIQTDFAQFEYESLQEQDLKNIQADYINSYLGKLGKSRKSGRDFSNFVTVIGLEQGGGIGDTHPDDIYVTIDPEAKQNLFNSDKQNSMQLIGWFRDVLNSNGMELNSVATGSGAGINSSWVITVGADFDKKRYEPVKRNKPTQASNYDNALQLMTEERDIFSYKFQGSLVQNIKIEKTEASNALKIHTDYAVADFLPQMDATKQEDVKKEVTVADRRRNLNILYAQLQNVTVTALCHPWIGPGKDFYIKGMGFWDGQYKALKVSHKLTGTSTFLTEISGARMIIPSKEEEEADIMELAAANGQTQKTQSVQQVYETPVTATPIVKEAPVQESKPVEETKPIVQTTQTVENQSNEDKWAKANDVTYHSQNKGEKITLEQATKIAKNLKTNNDDNDNEMIVKIYNSFKSITSASYIADIFFQLYPDEKEAVNILADVFQFDILKYLKQAIYKLSDEI